MDLLECVDFLDEMVGEYWGLNQVGGPSTKNRKDSFQMYDDIEHDFGFQIIDLIYRTGRSELCYRWVGFVRFVSNTTMNVTVCTEAGSILGKRVHRAVGLNSSFKLGFGKKSSCSLQITSNIRFTGELPAYFMSNLQKNEIPMF
uniref:Uncharacterized protein n=1 Tax=Romanomermis culicivorax TaxID=13658 RepID=A0A915JV73_ROMCU